MKFIFIISFFLIQSQILLASSNSSQENRKFYEDRTEFLKKYIKEIKEKRKINKNVNGSIVETLWGKIYTRIDIQSQNDIDNLTLQDCKNDGGIDCIVRFRSLKINPKYNRLAKYDKSKKTLKVLDQYLTSKKVYSTKGINILIAEKDFNNKDDFNCTKVKSNYREILNILRKEIELYPTSFLKNSGLKFVMICDKISNKGITPVGMAPGHFDKSPGVFYVNISEINSQGKNKNSIIKHVFHHEFYHIIDAKLAKIYLDDQWDKLNDQEYSDKLLVDRNVIDNSVKGYISKYARNSTAEDKAELFAFMITQHKLFKKTLKNDPILFDKSKLMILRLKSISNDINKNFWKRLN
ncbi:putative zinc-binding metallopeptidase [Candidatus Pelagibacter sp.]|uniref:putative zinc-binding metallopeptidase n=1 Tax=Candidatus Pelagibacter sp. TaxID=2024849 RepID=UPI003F87532C